jgi:four helix bundle protein
LDVYREAYRLALEVSRLTRRFPQVEQVELARQLRRAARSIPANIVEGWAKRSSAAEFKRYLQVSIGSCDEARMWLDLSRDEGYITTKECADLRVQFNRVGVMLQRLWKQWRSSTA